MYPSHFPLRRLGVISLAGAAMAWNKPPLAVAVIACSYVLVGVVGCIYHFSHLLAGERGAIWIELTELLALISGAGLLRGYNWARWLAVLWLAAHVVLTAFESLPQFAFHAGLWGAITWLLFRPDSAQYFRHAP
jgi:hypothetical protein